MEWSLSTWNEDQSSTDVRILFWNNLHKHTMPPKIQRLAIGSIRKQLSRYHVTENPPPLGWRSFFGTNFLWSGRRHIFWHIPMMVNISSKLLETHLWMISTGSERKRVFRRIPANPKHASKVTQTPKFHSEDFHWSYTKTWIRTCKRLHFQKDIQILNHSYLWSLWIHGPGICKLIMSSLVHLVRASRFGMNTQKSLIKRWGAITCPQRALEWQLKSQHLGSALPKFAEMEASFHGLVIVGWIFLSRNC